MAGLCAAPLIFLGLRSMLRAKDRKGQRRVSRRVLQPFATEPINPYMAEMKSTLQQLAASGRGILDTGEPSERLSERLARLGAGGGEEDCRAWREMLYGAKGLGESCGAVILDEEALRQSTSDGRPFPDLLKEQGIVLGVRGDTGYFPLNGYGEQATDGLVSMGERCQEWRSRGVRLVLWRTLIECSMELPTDVAVWENMSRLAQCAQVCHAHGLAVAAELQLSSRSGDGNHSIDRTAYVMEKVCSNAVRLLNEQDANLEAVVLLPSFCTPGSEVAPSIPEEVAETTARVLSRTVPPALAGIHPVGSGMSIKEAAMTFEELRATQMPHAVAPAHGVDFLMPVLEAWARGRGEGERGSAKAQELLLSLLSAPQAFEAAEAEEAVAR